MSSIFNFENLKVTRDPEDVTRYEVHVDMVFDAKAAHELAFAVLRKVQAECDHDLQDLPTCSKCGWVHPSAL
jgi:hypothetical protein